MKELSPLQGKSVLKVQSTLQRARTVIVFISRTHSAREILLYAIELPGSSKAARSHHVSFADENQARAALYSERIALHRMIHRSKCLAKIEASQL